LGEFIDVNYDRAIPSDQKIEMLVIGALINNGTLADSIVHGISRDDFYNEKNAIVFDHMVKIVEMRQLIDLNVLHLKLKETNSIDGVGGIHYLLEMSMMSVTTSHLMTHISELKRLSKRRKIIQGYTGVLQKSWSQDLSNEEVMYLSDSVSESLRDEEANKIETLEEITKRVTKGFKDAKDGVVKKVSLTGMSHFDRVVQPRSGTVVVVAGRPGMGKTMFSNTVACNCAKNGQHVVIWTMEMASDEYALMMMSNVSDIPYKEFLEDKIDIASAEYDRAVTEFRKLNVTIIDRPKASVRDIELQVMSIHKRKPVDVLIIDYLGLIDHDAKKGNMTDQIGDTTKNIKRLARQTKGVVVELAQLSREVEKAPSKIPTLAHLRSSGSIEQDADIVVMLYRPDYYGISDKFGKSLKGKAKLFVRKNRRGKLCSVDHFFEPLRARFQEMDPFDDFEGISKPKKVEEKEIDDEFGEF